MGVAVRNPMSQPGLRAIIRVLGKGCKVCIISDADPSVAYLSLVEAILSIYLYPIYIHA